MLVIDPWVHIGISLDLVRIDEQSTAPKIVLESRQHVVVGHDLSQPPLETGPTDIPVEDHSFISEQVVTKHPTLSKGSKCNTSTLRSFNLQG